MCERVRKPRLGDYRLDWANARKPNTKAGESVRRFVPIKQDEHKMKDGPKRDGVLDEVKDWMTQLNKSFAEVTGIDHYTFD